MTNLMLKELIT